MAVLIEQQVFWGIIFSVFGIFDAHQPLPNPDLSVGLVTTQHR